MARILYRKNTSSIFTYSATIDNKPIPRRDMEIVKNIDAMTVIVIDVVWVVVISETNKESLKR